MRQWVVLCLAIAIALFGSELAMSETFPNRPVRLIVPFAAGGSTDAIARITGERAAELLGQPVVIDNRPGAGGSIGPGLVARAAPDGYTLMVAPPSTVTVPKLLNARLDYDPMTALMPVAMLAEEPIILMGSRSLPASTLPELVVLLRQWPGRYSFSSAGAGSMGHMVGEFFNVVAGTDVQHVTYRGGAASVAAVVQDEVALSITSPGSAHAFLDSIRVFAVARSRRAVALPDIPTAAEQGLPDLSVISWTGLMAPVGVPHPVVETLARAFIEAVRTDAVRQRLLAMGIEPSPASTEEFATILAEDLTRWRNIVERTRSRARFD